MIMKITEEKGNAKLRGSQSSLVGSLGRLLGRHTPPPQLGRHLHHYHWADTHIPPLGRLLGRHTPTLKVRRKEWNFVFFERKMATKGK